MNVMFRSTFQDKRLFGAPSGQRSAGTAPATYVVPVGGEYADTLRNFVHVAKSQKKGQRDFGGFSLLSFAIRF
jgi:hypothetical protein